MDLLFTSNPPSDCLSHALSYMEMSSFDFNHTVSLPKSLLHCDPTQTDSITALLSVGLSPEPLLSLFLNDVYSKTPSNPTLDSVTDLFNLSNKWVNFLTHSLEYSSTSLTDSGKREASHLLSRLLSCAEYISCHDPSFNTSFCSFFVSTCRKLTIDPCYPLFLYCFPDHALSIIPTSTDFPPYLSNSCNLAPLIIKGAVLLSAKKTSLTSLLYISLLLFLAEEHGNTDSLPLASYFAISSDLPSSLSECIERLEVETRLELDSGDSSLPCSFVIDTTGTLDQEAQKEEVSEEWASIRDVMSMVGVSTEERINTDDLQDLDA
ncbi:hypothetical protein GEMRC1_001903 [Eukaryota sp. GEM-RC1]